MGTPYSAVPLQESTNTRPVQIQPRWVEIPTPKHRDECSEPPTKRLRFETVTPPVGAENESMINQEILEEFFHPMQ